MKKTMFYVVTYIDVNGWERELIHQTDVQTLIDTAISENGRNIRVRKEERLWFAD